MWRADQNTNLTINRTGRKRGLFHIRQIRARLNLKVKKPLRKAWRAAA